MDVRFAFVAIGLLCPLTAAQTITVLHGQKVMVDKNGTITVPTSPALQTSPAPLVGGSDSCVTPDVISGGGPFAFDTTTASTGAEGQNEALCNVSSQIGINRDVWFTWTSSFTGTADLSMCGMASFDTKVAVYPGATCPTSSALACNDDYCGLQSHVQFSASAGNSYVIQVGEWGTGAPSPGSFVITQFIPTPGDDCQLPTALSGPGTYPFNSATATDGTTGTTSCAAAHKDLWYTYAATASGSATITTCGLITSPDVDTVIAVYAGAGCPTATSIACDDDDFNCATTLNSTVTWPTTCGQTYTLQVGAYSATYNITGSFMISETGTQCGPTGVPYCFGDGMPNSSCLYFQGTTQISVAFGDGLRCAGGTVIRLATKTNVGGASQYPGAGNPPVHIKGAVSAPGTRTYQTWYRNAAAFCTPSTFNLTNGVLITWQ